MRVPGARPHCIERRHHHHPNRFRRRRRRRRCRLPFATRWESKKTSSSESFSSSTQNAGANGVLCGDENDDQKHHHVRVVVVVVVVVPCCTPWTMMVACNAPRRAFVRKGVKKHDDDDLIFCYTNKSVLYILFSVHAQLPFAHQIAHGPVFERHVVSRSDF